MYCACVITGTVQGDGYYKGTTVLKSSPSSIPTLTSAEALEEPGLGFGQA